MPPEAETAETDRRDPKVTVLLSTYNRPDYLREAVHSVVQQSLQDWELLVMNDGGLDVAPIVEAFNDPRICYFPDDVNRKLPYRFNFGLRQARGRYIAYLGDDDIYYPHHLQVLSEALDADPEVGVVYSDLYGVQFVKSPATGKRYPLNKMIQVARDYNRDFMFYFNHTLHVSLMHRRELGLAVGGYDESVTVLIDWNLTRKLSFYTDFKYVPVPTGEYYMPISNSDRISNLERRDPERFKHNLRKIKADLPPLPWPKVKRVAVVLPVNKWSEDVKKMLTAMIDALCYPVSYLVINNTPNVSASFCLRQLGEIGELKNVSLITPPEPLNRLEAYRFGALQTDADYLYLPSERAVVGYEYRLIRGLHYLAKSGHGGAKWSLEAERNGPFDILIERERFLAVSEPGNGEMEMTVGVVPAEAPASLRSDLFHHLASKCHQEGGDDMALAFIRNAETASKGAAKAPFWIDLYAKICHALGRFDEAEGECRALIEKGYGADNWIRLGRMLQAKGRPGEAIAAFRKGLEEIGLGEADLNDPVFPVAYPQDFGAFLAYMGLGECALCLDRPDDAARMFHKAAKLKANSHLPFLAFGRLFLKSGEVDRARAALGEAAARCPQNVEALQLLGQLAERQERTAEAYGFFRQAFDLDPTDAGSALALYRLGTVLGCWQDLRQVFQSLLEHRPGHVEAIEKLCRIYREGGAISEAAALVEKGALLDPTHPGIGRVRRELRQLLRATG